MDYLVIEYIEGASLAVLLKEGPLDLQRALDVAVQAAHALAHAHQQRIIHRDIKPANLMVTRSGTVKVLDFGVAKVQEPADASRSGAALGTLAYMAPEQLRGEAVHPATDVWSLGCLLQEMLTGSRPFAGETDAAVVANIFSGTPKPLSALDSACLPRRHRAIAPERAGAPLPVGGGVRGCRRGIPRRCADRRLRPPVVRRVVVLALLALLVLGRRRRDRGRVLAKRRACALGPRGCAAGDYARWSKRIGTAPRMRPPSAPSRTCRTTPPLAALWPTIAVTLSMATEPEGADVYCKEYSDVDGEWHHLGRGPLDGRPPAARNHALPDREGRLRSGVSRAESHRTAGPRAGRPHRRRRRRARARAGRQPAGQSERLQLRRARADG